MELLELMKRRYSARKYEARQVEEEKINLILEAGRVAPTAANTQPQRILVIKSEAGLKKVSNAANFFKAPLVLIVCGDLKHVWTRPFDSKKMTDIDTAIVTDHMMLMAQNLGLATCWITYFKKDVLKVEFDIPENVEAISMLAIGYDKGDRPSENRHELERKMISETVFYETF